MFVSRYKCGIASAITHYFFLRLGGDGLRVRVISGFEGDAFLRAFGRFDVDFAILAMLPICSTVASI